MKKITLGLFASICAIGSAFGQVNLTMQALPYTHNLLDRLPNGTVQHKSLHGTFIYLQSELTALTGSVVTSISFVRADGTDPFPSAGNFTLYLANTGDLSYQKGASFNTATSGMTPYYIGAWNTPTTVGQGVVNLPLTPAFTYTGGGIYVGYAFEETTPAVNTNTYQARFAGTVGTSTLGAYSYSTSNLTAPDNMTLSPIRPIALITFSNQVTNDIDVNRIVAFGRVPSSLGSQSIEAIIHNRSNTTLNNIPVNLVIAGANSFADSKTVTSIAPGAQVSVTFAPFNAANFGLNTMTVSVPADQVNGNNQEVWSQTVTCSEWANNPPLAATVFTNNNIGYTSGSGVISSKYTSPSNLNLTGIRLAVGSSTANAGKIMYGVLFNSAGAVVATTNSITVTAPMQNTYVTFNFASPQPIAANQQYYIGIGIPAGPMYPVGALSPTNYTVSGYYASALTGGTFSQINFGFLGIEALVVSPSMSISAAPSSNTVCAGQSVTLTATGPANTTYSWSGTQSPSTVVVTPGIAPTQTQVVSNYNVEGVDANSCPLVGAVASVTVYGVPSVTVANKTVCIGSKTTLNPTGAVSYTVNGGALSNATGTVFTITPSAVGAETYTVVGSNAIGCQSAQKTATVTANACVGIEEIIGGNAIRIYPNPATSGVTRISGLQGSNLVTVYNTLGQAVITNNSNEGTVEINLSQQANGNYLVKVQGDSGVQTFKLVNQK